MTGPLTDEGRSVDVRQALKKIRLFELQGFPPEGGIDIELADDDRPPIWVLKNSGHWRCYFAIDHEARRIIYVHATTKKKNPRDPDESAKARREYTAYANGQRSLERLVVPPGESFR